MDVKDTVTTVLSEDYMKEVIEDHLYKQNYGTRHGNVTTSVNTDFGYSGYRVAHVQRVV